MDEQISTGSMEEGEIYYGTRKHLVVTVGLGLMWRVDTQPVAGSGVRFGS